MSRCLWLHSTWLSRNPSDMPRQHIQATLLTAHTQAVQPPHLDGREVARKPGELPIPPELVGGERPTAEPGVSVQHLQGRERKSDVICGKAR